MKEEFIWNDGTVVNTKYGKLRGYRLDGIYSFRGIPYAKAERFEEPAEPDAWEGIKDAVNYGPVCPLLEDEMPDSELYVPHLYWPASENCQNLNIWTSSINSNSRRPVMVWLHGGGFFAGSSIEQLAYEGSALCRAGNVVVVSVNHRVNVLGYLNMEPYGDRFKNSGNAGNADLVAALKYVHDNIASFGGDPDNVTIFGQSGGGMKVWTLMQTPSADGLYHKAIIQSGIVEGYIREEDDDSSALIGRMSSLLSIEKGSEAELQKVPLSDLHFAYNTAVKETESGYVGGQPVRNSFYLGNPLDVGFTSYAKTVPLIIGSNLAEFCFRDAIPENVSDDEIMTALKGRYKEYTEKLVRLFKSSYPERSLRDLLVYDSLFRKPSIDFARKSGLERSGDTYCYLFTANIQMKCLMPAWHCAEIPFVFHNRNKVPYGHLDGMDRLEKIFSEAWIAFAETGKPSSSALPDWPASEDGHVATMIIDKECRVEVDFDYELATFHDKVTKALAIIDNENVAH